MIAKFEFTATVDAAPEKVAALKADFEQMVRGLRQGVPETIRFESAIEVDGQRTNSLNYAKGGVQ